MMLQPPVMVALFAVSALIFCPVGCGVVEDVKDFVEAFAGMTSPAADIGEELKIISLGMAGFIRMAGPAGTFVALAMQKGFEPESEEMEALKLLHSTMKARFDQLDGRIEHLGNSLVEHFALSEYEEHVVFPLLVIQRVYNKVTDPERNRSLYREQFVSYCNDLLSSPHNVLSWINVRVNVNCKMPSKHDAIIYTKAREIFDAVDNNSTKFERLSQRAYEEKRWRIISAISFLGNISLLDPIQTLNRGKNIFQLENAIANLDQFLQKVNITEAGVLSQQKMISTWNWKSQRTSGKLHKYRCLLKDIIDANDDRRDALLQMSQMIELHSMKLVSIGSLCANISHKGDRRGTEDELKDIRTLGTNIANAMGKYSAAKLESSWPSILTYHATKILQELDHPDIDRNTSRAIKFALDSRGPFRFFHNVVLAPSWNGTAWYFPECEPDFCFNVQNASGSFNIFVTRYEHKQQLRARNAYHYVQQRKNRILDIIRDVCYAQGLDLPDCLGRIKAEMPGLRSFVGYRSILFVHTRGLRKSDATIPSAMTSFTTSGATRTTELLELFHNPGLLSFAHRYKLFLLL